MFDPRCLNPVQKPRRDRSPWLTFALLAVAVGCGGSAAAPASGAAPQPTDPETAALLSQEEMVELCVTLHQKVEACPGEFVAMNVELRAKYDPELARLLEDPEARLQIEAAGRAETFADAASARQRCAEFAQPQWGPAQPRGDRARMDGCYAQATCGAQMTCLQPFIEPRFAYRAKQAAPGK
jgi:hypothetical protein